MKTPMSMKVLLLSSVLLAASTLIGFGASPEDLRAEARKLMEKAEALKAEGKAGAVEDLLRQARKLEAQAREMSEARGGNERGEPVRPAAELERLRAELKELEKKGRREEAAEVRERIAFLEKQGAQRPARGEMTPMAERRTRLQQEIDELHRLGRHERAQQLERELAAMRGPESGPRPGGPSTGSRPNPERIEHLRQAIEHLRAAGLPDMAERLERQADAGMRGPMGFSTGGVAMGRGPMGRGPMAGRQGPMMSGLAQPEMMSDLQRALDEVRAQLREMQRALAETREQVERRPAEGRRP